MRYGRKFVCDDDLKMHTLVELYKTGVKRKRVFGPFALDDKGTITYTSQETSGYGDNRTTEKLVDIVAVKVKGISGDILLGNSAILSNVGAYSSYGNRVPNRSQTLIQRKLEGNGIVMIPFNAIEQAKLSVQDIVVIDQSLAETIIIDVKEYNHTLQKEVIRKDVRHFTGASLFKVNDVHFLFDLDRREVEHRIFNPFIVRLPKPVNTIAEAYASLKPELVLQAEKEGKEVLRQGEWFFIESEAPHIPVLSSLELLAIRGLGRIWRNENNEGISEADTKRLEALRDALPRQLSLQAGRNRPNEAEKGLQLNGVTYVTGLLKHSGREHAELKLEKWYTAVPNTAIESFTVSGDID